MQGQGHKGNEDISLPSSKGTGCVGVLTLYTAIARIVGMLPSPKAMGTAEVECLTSSQWGNNQAQMGLVDKGAMLQSG